MVGDSHRPPRCSSNYLHAEVTPQSLRNFASRAGPALIWRLGRRNGRSRSRAFIPGGTAPFGIGSFASAARSKHLRRASVSAIPEQSAPELCRVSSEKEDGRYGERLRVKRKGSPARDHCLDRGGQIHRFASTISAVDAGLLHQRRCADRAAVGCGSLAGACAPFADSARPAEDQQC